MSLPSETRAICNLLRFTIFTRKYGSFCYILLRRRPPCKLDAFLLLSINGDLRLTLADAGFHYCQHYFSKRTQCLGRFLELVLRNITEAKRYAALWGRSWWNARHQCVLEQALPVKTVSDESSPYRRNELTVNELIHSPDTICKSQVWRSTYFKAKLTYLIIAQAIQEPYQVFVLYQSGAHDSDTCLFTSRGITARVT